MTQPAANSLPLPPLDPESARFRLYQSVSRFVRHLASVRPIALVIDDLHWADESSMELLVFLANEVATELKKVTWPTAKEVRAATIVVIVMALISALILGLFDFVWSNLTELVYG